MNVLAAAALAGFGLIGLHYDIAFAGFVLAIGLLAFVCEL